jgi:hypothetical protein
MRRRSASRAAWSTLTGTADMRAATPNDRTLNCRTAPVTWLAGALVDVNIVQADRVMADADLAGAGFAHSQVDELHHLGAAVVLDLDGLVHGLDLL